MGISLSGQANALRTAATAEDPSAAAWFFVDFSRLSVSSSHPAGGPIDGGTLLMPFGTRLRACDGRPCRDPPLCHFAYELGAPGTPPPPPPALVPAKIEVISYKGNLNQREFAATCRVPPSNLVSQALTGLTLPVARRRMRGASAFELFRFDFLVDEDAQPVLTEVNLSPNLATAPGAPEDGAVKETLLVETLRLVTQRFAPAPTATPAATPTATPAAAPLAVPTGDGSLKSLSSVPGSVPADLRGVTCGGSCCRLQAACNSSWARLTRSHCLSRAELQMLHLAAAEQRVAVAGGMQRIWPARLGTGNVRTLWPVPPREDRLLACWTRAAS